MVAVSIVVLFFFINIVVLFSHIDYKSAQQGVY